MRPKIKITPGFPTVEEVVKTLGVTKKEERAVDVMLKGLYITLPHGHSGRTVSKKTPKVRSKKLSAARGKVTS